jgi:hypothetical protein
MFDIKIERRRRRRRVSSSYYYIGSVPHSSVLTDLPVSFGRYSMR